MGASEHDMERAGEQRHHRSKRHRSKEAVQRRPGFLRKYWAECTSLVLFSLGVFLLLEQMRIKVVLWRWLVATFHAAVAFGRNAETSVRGLLERVEVSDIVGICLIVAAISIMIYGLRSRAIARSLDLMEGADCPEGDCNGIMRRARRTRFDHVVGMLLRVRVKPYVCEECSSRAVVWARRETL